MAKEKAASEENQKIAIQEQYQRTMTEFRGKDQEIYQMKSIIE
jgi:hypothetical protein